MSATHQPSDADRSFAERERASLAELFDEGGPDAKTLCGGWSTRDLAAHLVLREGHPAAIGIVVPQLSGWTSSQQQKIAATPFAAIVERFRHGPPTISPLRLPGVDSAANTFEFFVHHEDIRRAQPSWEVRDLADADQRLLWRHLTKRVRMFLRRPPVPVRLHREGFGSISVGNTDLSSAVTLTGEPAELVLYLHGRGRQANVEVDGSAESLEQWSRVKLAV
jgi:uncharacterized protein (TIGR03085 family)